MAILTGTATATVQLTPTVAGVHAGPQDGKATATVKLTPTVIGGVQNDGTAKPSVKLIPTATGDFAPDADASGIVQLAMMAKGLLAKLSSPVANVQLDPTVTTEKLEPVMSQSFSLEGNIMYNSVSVYM